MSDYGDTVICTVPEGVFVISADQRVLISDELWQQALDGDLEHVQAGEGLIQINAVNGSWTYRLTGEWHFIHARYAELHSVTQSDEQKRIDVEHTARKRGSLPP